MFSNLPGLITASIISTLLPFVVWQALWWRRRRSFFPAALWLFFLLAAATEIIILTHNLLHKPSAWIVHIYTAIEYGLLAHALSAWQESPAIRKAIRASIPAYLCLYLLARVTGIEPFEATTINYLTRPIALLLISGFSWYTLSQTWLHDSEKLSRNFRFWILISLAGYYSSSVMLDAFLYTANHDVLLHIFHARAILNILHNILFTIGVIVAFGSRSPERPEEGSYSEKIRSMQ